MPQPELRVDQRVRRSVRGLLREALVTGMAVVVPLLITVIVLAIAFQYVYRYLNLFSTVVLSISKRIYVPLLGTLPQQTFIELLTPLVLVLTILLVGVVVNSSRYGQRAVDYFDYAIAQIPGVGSVYESFRKMSDVVIESDMQNFREVKLVEFPHRDTYTLGFVTAETPPQLADPVGHREMFTLFLPLAPNPVMGGHLVHLPADRVHDVDMSVEEGIRTVVTSGVAVGSRRTPSTGLSPEELRGLSSVEFASQQLDPASSSHGLPRVDHDEARRADSYDRVVSPASATTAADIERRARPRTATPDGTEAEADADADAEADAGTDADLDTAADDGPVPGTRRSGDPAGSVADERRGTPRPDGDGRTPSDGTVTTSPSSTPTPAEVAGRPDLAARAFGLDADDERFASDRDDVDGGSALAGDDDRPSFEWGADDPRATDDGGVVPPAPDDLMVEEGDGLDGQEHEMRGDSDTVAANGGSHAVDDAGAVRMDDPPAGEDVAADSDCDGDAGADIESTLTEEPGATPAEGSDATPAEGSDATPVNEPAGASTERSRGEPEVADE